MKKSKFTESQIAMILKQGADGVPIERFNRTVSHEWLRRTIFHSIEEVQEIATKWAWTYNHVRPNIANGRITPAKKLEQYQTQPMAS